MQVMWVLFVTLRIQNNSRSIPKSYNTRCFVCDLDFDGLQLFSLSKLMIVREYRDAKKSAMPLANCLQRRRCTNEDSIAIVNVLNEELFIMN